MKQVTRDRCAARPEECYQACIGKRSGECSFRLALALQENESVIARRYAQLMFAMACALGKASGCTNRAAHVRRCRKEKRCPRASLLQEILQARPRIRRLRFFPPSADVNV